MRAFGREIGVRVPMCLSRVLFEVVITKGTYGMLVPMNKYTLVKGIGKQHDGSCLYQHSQDLEAD